MTEAETLLERVIQKVRNDTILPRQAEFTRLSFHKPQVHVEQNADDEVIYR